MSSDLTATIAQLAVAWRRAGVSEGDLILLHNDIRRTLRMIGRHSPRDGVTAILQSFLEAVGASGLLRSGPKELFRAAMKSAREYAKSKGQ